MTLQAAGEHVSGSAASRFAYDVFVVHADAAADEAFVNGYLLPKLGLAPERVLRRQTLEPGQFITKEIERGVRSSRYPGMRPFTEGEDRQARQTRPAIGRRLGQAAHRRCCRARW